VRNGTFDPQRADRLTGGNVKKATKITDLSAVEPGPAADPLFDLQQSWMTVRIPGMEVGLGHRKETHGASGAVSSLATLSAGLIPAVVISVVGVAAGAPGWLTVTLAAAVLVLTLISGVLFIGRLRQLPVPTGIRKPSTTVAPTAMGPGAAPTRPPAKSIGSTKSTGTKSKAKRKR
jgi:hypothetical protein